MVNRLAESGDDLWNVFQKLCNSGWVTLTQGLCYPVARIIGVPGFFTIAPHNEYRTIHPDKLGYSLSLYREQDALNDAFDKDQVEILVLSRPGYLSGWEDGKVLQVLHSPKGNSFR